MILRPTRIGFLVKPDDSASLRRIFQVCTCLWGGIYSPIIPVSATLPDAWKERHGRRDPHPIDIANGYMRFFEPDVFVEAEDGLAKQLGLAIGDLQDYGHPRLLISMRSSQSRGRMTRTFRSARAFLAYTGTFMNESSSSSLGTNVASH